MDHIIAGLCTQLIRNRADEYCAEEALDLYDRAAKTKWVVVMSGDVHQRTVLGTYTSATVCANIARHFNMLTLHNKSPLSMFDLRKAQTHGVPAFKLPLDDLKKLASHAPLQRAAAVVVLPERPDLIADAFHPEQFVHPDLLALLGSHAPLGRLAVETRTGRAACWRSVLDATRNLISAEFVLNTCKTAPCTPLLLAGLASGNRLSAVQREHRNHSTLYSALLLVYSQRLCEALFPSDLAAAQLLSRYRHMIHCLPLAKSRLQLLHARNSAPLKLNSSGSSSLLRYPVGVGFVQQHSNSSMLQNSSLAGAPIPVSATKASLFALPREFVYHVRKCEKWRVSACPEEAVLCARNSDRLVHVFRVKGERSGEKISYVLCRNEFVEEFVRAFHSAAATLDYILCDPVTKADLYRRGALFYRPLVVVKFDASLAAPPNIPEPDAVAWVASAEKFDDKGPWKYALLMGQQLCHTYAEARECAAKWSSALGIGAGIVPQIRVRLFPQSRLPVVCAAARCATPAIGRVTDPGAELIRSVLIKAAVHKNARPSVLFCVKQKWLCANTLSAPTDGLCTFGAWHDNNRICAHAQFHSACAILTRDELPLLVFNSWMRCADTQLDQRLAYWFAALAPTVTAALGENCAAQLRVLQAEQSKAHGRVRVRAPDSQEFASGGWNVSRHFRGVQTELAGLESVPLQEVHAAYLLNFVRSDPSDEYRRWLHVGMILYAINAKSAWLRLCFRWWSYKTLPTKYKDADHVGEKAKWSHLSRKNGDMGEIDALKKLKSIAKQSGASADESDCVSVLSDMIASCKTWFGECF